MQMKPPFRDSLQHVDVKCDGSMFTKLCVAVCSSFRFPLLVKLPANLVYKSLPNPARGWMTHFLFPLPTHCICQDFLPKSFFEHENCMVTVFSFLWQSLEPSWSYEGWKHQRTKLKLLCGPFTGEARTVAMEVFDRLNDVAGEENCNSFECFSPTLADRVAADAWKFRAYVLHAKLFRTSKISSKYSGGRFLPPSSAHVHPPKGHSTVSKTSGHIFRKLVPRSIFTSIAYVCGGFYLTMRMAATRWDKERLQSHGHDDGALGRLGSA